MNATVVPHILKNTINGILNLINPSLFSAVVIDLDFSQRMSDICHKNFYPLMKKTKHSFEEACGKHDYFLNHFNRN